MLSSCAGDVTSFAVVDPDINFSDHLPLLAVINTQYVVNAPGLSRTKGENKPVQNLLRWDKADVHAYYKYTGASLSPLLSRLDQMLSSLENCSVLDHNRPAADVTEFVERMYYEEYMYCLVLPFIHSYSFIEKQK